MFADVQSPGCVNKCACALGKHGGVRRSAEVVTSVMPRRDEIRQPLEDKTFTR